jgi:hypothetical protein
LESAAVRKAASERGLPPPALKYREHGKDHLSGETDRSRSDPYAAKLIHERSIEHGTKSDLTHISTMNATKPINDRAGTVRLTSSRSTHQRQTNQFAASIIGASMMTAVVSPRRGASSTTRMVPRIKPIEKTTIA